MWILGWDLRRSCSAICVAGAVLAIAANDPDVEVNLGDDEFELEDSRRGATDRIEDGPRHLRRPDRRQPADHASTTWATTPRRAGSPSWPSPRATEACIVDWDADDERLPRTAKATTYPPDGEGLDQFPTRVEDDTLYVDLGRGPSDDQAPDDRRHHPHHRQRLTRRSGTGSGGQGGRNSRMPRGGIVSPPVGVGVPARRVRWPGGGRARAITSARSRPDSSPSTSASWGDRSSGASATQRAPAGLGGGQLVGQRAQVDPGLWAAGAVLDPGLVAVGEAVVTAPHDEEGEAVGGVVDRHRVDVLEALVAEAVAGPLLVGRRRKSTTARSTSGCSVIGDRTGGEGRLALGRAGRPRPPTGRVTGRGRRPARAAEPQQLP